MMTGPLATTARPTLLLPLLFAALWPCLSDAQSSWPGWGGNKENWRNSKLKCLDKTKLGSITPKWQIQIKDTVASVPTTCGGFVYYATSSSIVKVSTAGVVQWENSFGSLVQPAGSRSSVAFPPDCSRLYFTATQWKGNGKANAWLISAPNRKNWEGGKVLTVQLDDDMSSRMTLSPTYYNGSVYVGVSSNQENSQRCCTFRGSMLRVDAADMSIKWKVYTVPAGYFGGAVWGSAPAIDAYRNRVCFGTGNNLAVPVSVLQCVKNAGKDLKAQAKCVASDNYIDSLLCLDIPSGKISLVYNRMMAGSKDLAGTLDIWGGKQMHDITRSSNSILTNGDDDYAQAPIFVANTTDRTKDLLIGTSKSGIVTAVYAETGKVAWGPTKVMGQNEWQGAAMMGSCTNGAQYCVAKHGPNALTACVSVKSGKILWKKVLNMGAYGPAACTPDVVFVPQFDGKLVAFDVKDGTQLLSYNTGPKLDSGASIVNGTLYIGSGRKGLAFVLPKKAGC